MLGKRSVYRRDRKTLTGFFLFFFSLISISGQIADNPGIISAGVEKLDSMESWLLYEKGLYSYNRRDYGEALNFFPVKQSLAVERGAKDCLPNNFWLYIFLVLLRRRT